MAKYGQYGAGMTPGQAFLHGAEQGAMIGATAIFNPIGAAAQAVGAIGKLFGGGINKGKRRTTKRKAGKRKATKRKGGKRKKARH